MKVLRVVLKAISVCVLIALIIFIDHVLGIHANATTFHGGLAHDLYYVFTSFVGGYLVFVLFIRK